MSSLPQDNQQPLKSAEVPFLLRPKILSFFIILLVGLRFAGLTISLQKTSYAQDITAQNILAAINKERALRNILTLNTNPKLSSAAQSKADDMITRKYFDHIDPDGNYIWPKIEQAGYSPYLQLGENLAINFYSTDSLIQAWMNSPTHRANVLNEGFKDQGLGLSQGIAAQQEYDTAIVNTFGTLLTKTTPSESLIAAPKPTQVPKPSLPQASTSTPKPTAAPKPKSTPKPTAVPTPIPTAAPTQSQTSSFDPLTLPLPSPQTGILHQDNSEPAQQPIKPRSSTSTSSLATLEKNELPALLATQVTTSGKQNTPIPLRRQSSNRYLILVFGAVLLFVLTAELRTVSKKSISLVDKKINNLAVLILSLAVVTLMYWL